MLARAKSVLAGSRRGATRPAELPRGSTICRSFASAAAAPPPSDPLGDALAAIEPDALTPREALDALYALKRLASHS